MERVAFLISRCTTYERLYLTDFVPKDAEEATENLRRGLLALYTAILHALCQLIRVFQGRVPDFLNGYSHVLCGMHTKYSPTSKANSGYQEN